MSANFKFVPMQYVTIHHFGLHCEGRVVRCIHEAGPNIYDVQYCIDGRLQRNEFYEDELSPKGD